jgi:hypothetical protein
MVRVTLVLAMLWAWSITGGSAQTSASYRLTEATLNAGGNPSQGSLPASASFRIRLDAIGEAALPGPQSSGSFRADGGFVGTFRPPEEVRRLRFTDLSTLEWDPERSIGTYAVYRDALEALPASGGACRASGFAASTFVDRSAPKEGRGWFYLVTARNRLREEGTRGTRSDGIPRPATAPCP